MLLGTVTIHKVNITITSSNKTWEYNGEEQVTDEVKKNLANELDYPKTLNPNNEEKFEYEIVVKPTFTAKITDAGFVFNAFTCEIFNEDETVNLTTNFNLNLVYGTLTVTPIEIIVQSKSETREYNGLPLENEKDEDGNVIQTEGVNWNILSGYVLNVEGNEHVLTVEVVGSRTDPGVSFNTIAGYEIVNNNGESVKHNYKVTLMCGTLTVTQSGLAPTGTSLNHSGSIAYTPVETRTVASVTADQGGTLYLRSSNFGDYDGRIWDNSPDVYDGALIDNKYGMSYLTSLAMEYAGYSTNTLSVAPTALRDYVLPYNMAIPQSESEQVYALRTSSAEDYLVQTTDTRYYAADYTKTYSLSYYVFDYLSSTSVPTVPPEYLDVVREYEEFVKKHYTNVSDEMRVYLERVIAENNLSADDPAGVVEFVKKIAPYNKNYDMAVEEKSSNVAISFMNGELGGGVCSHFATVATLLFRTLGIPARYTYGFALTVNSGGSVVLSNTNAHAWVELFIHDLGWVNVEVTPTTRVRPSNATVIRPIDVSEKFNGQTISLPNSTSSLYSTGNWISKMEAQGYEFVIEIVGEQSAVGTSESVLKTFEIYQQINGERVRVTEELTEQYSLWVETGKLQLYYTTLLVEGIYDQTKVYDGKPLEAAASNYKYDKSLLLSENHEVVVTFLYTLTNAGTISNQFVSPELYLAISTNSLFAIIPNAWYPSY